jgi:integrase
MKTDGLKLEQTDKASLKVGVKSDGTKYSVRDNRDKFFFPNEWMTFFDVIKKSQKMPFDFLINTGCRVNEGLHVQVQDCDLIRGNIILRVTKVKAKKGEKNPRPRTVSISEQFAKRLKHYIIENNLKNEDYLFNISKPGMHLALKRGLAKAQIKEAWMFSLHNIRKTHGNYLKALGIETGEICTRLGHDFNTFLRSYSSPDIFSYKDKQDMRLILGNLYQK